ncbi:hypothetical protein FRC07_009003, partial [Ceratobasidium sp. 392]
YAAPQSGLQLPVGSFMPAPIPSIGASDIALYVTPVAAAAWPSSVDVVEYAQEVAVAIRRFVSQTSRVLRRYAELYANLLFQDRPKLTLASEWVPGPYWELGPSKYRNESLLHLPPTVSIVYPILLNVLWPTPTATTQPSRASDICTLPILGVRVVGYQSPNPVVPRLVTAIAIRHEPYVPSVIPSRLPQPSPELVVYESFADLAGVAVGFPVHYEPTIIYVRNCLFIGLPIVLCLTYICCVCVLFAYRLAVRLVKATCDWVRAQCCSALVRGLTNCSEAWSSCRETAERVLADTCGILWSLFITGRVRYSAKGEQIVASALLVEVEVVVEVKVKIEVPTPTETKQTKTKKKRTKKGKAKHRNPNAADARDETGSAAKLKQEPVVVDAPPEDDGGGWTLVTRKHKRTGGAY